MPAGGKPSIAICSAATDIHALAIAHELKLRHCQCYLIGTDSLVEAGGLTWSLDAAVSDRLRALTDTWFQVADLDLIWWRRASPAPRRPAGVSDEEFEFACREWSASLLGILHNRFAGTWISEPSATSRAENKLIQLQAATTAGLRVPATLVSQEPETVREFIDQHSGIVVAKPVRGIQRCLQPVKVSSAKLSDELIRFTPAIYQEFIPGDRHLRINCFGDAIYPMLYYSTSLDSRDTLPRHEPFDLPSAITSAIKETMRLLDIRMAIMDAKLTPDDEFVWLEANPQGQFIYQDGLSEFQLMGPFADFLIEKATE